jgi:hypothetical protein
MALVDAARAFDETALRINDAHPADLVRWADPIFVAVADSDDLRPLAAQIEASVRFLADIAGVPATRVAADDARANFLVRQTGAGVRTACRTSISSRGGRIAHVDVAINVAAGASLTRCINHEVMHGFGFRSHASGAQSILSYRQVHLTQPSTLDHILLETLYDRRLHPGMDVATAAPLACGIIAGKLGVARRDASAHCARRVPGGGRLAAYDDSPGEPSLGE